MINTHIYIYIYIHMYTIIYVCVCVYTYVCMYAYIYIYVCISLNTYIYIYIYLCMHIYIYMYIYIYIHVCIRIGIMIYNPSEDRRPMLASGQEPAGYKRELEYRTPRLITFSRKLLEVSGDFAEISVGTHYSCRYSWKSVFSRLLP